MSTTKSATAPPVLPTGLVRDPGPGVGLGEAPVIHQPLDRHLGVGVDDHYPGQILVLGADRLTVGPNEQRDVEDDHRVGSGDGRPAIRDLGAHGRMDDPVEGLQLVGIVEHDGGHGAPVERPVRRDYARTPALDHGLEDRRTRLLELTDDAIGVDEDRSPLHEPVGNGGLAGSDAPGQPDLDHRGTLPTGAPTRRWGGP